MAIVRTAPTPKIRYTPFTGLSEMQRAQSGIARAEVVYNINDGVWSGPGAGNVRLLDIAMTLDRDFGYVLTDCTATFEDASNLSLEANAELEIQTTPGHPDNELYYFALESRPTRMDDLGTTAIGSIPASYYNSIYPRSSVTARAAAMNFQLINKPKFLIYPFADSNYPSTVSVRFAEARANGAELDYKFVCRFLQYDISQNYNYVIQSPQLTR